MKSKCSVQKVGVLSHRRAAGVLSGEEVLVTVLPVPHRAFARALEPLLCAAVTLPHD